MAGRTLLLPQIRLASIQSVGVARPQSVRLLSSGGHYRVLGLQPSCSDKELKDAYRRQVTRWHPDVFAGEEMSVDKSRAAEEFRRSTEAFEAIVQERSSRGAGPGTTAPGQSWYSWTSTRSSARPEPPRDGASRRHTENSARQGFWQRPDDPRQQHAGNASSGNTATKSDWGNELDEFFRGIRSARSSSDWRRTQRPNSHRHNDEHRHPDGQFAEDLHMKFAVMWAEEWSKIFDKSGESQSFRYSTAGPGTSGRHRKTTREKQARTQPEMTAQSHRRKQERQEQQRMQEQQRRRTAVNDELEELYALYSAGSLTEEEFNEAKVVVHSAAVADSQRDQRAKPAPEPEPEPESSVHMDPFIMAEMARAKLAWRASTSGQAHESVSAMQEGAAVGHPLMCVAAARAGRDEIVQTALQYFESQSHTAGRMSIEHRAVCAQMFAAALSQRPAEVAIAELLLRQAAVSTSELLPAIPTSAHHSRRGLSGQVQGYQIDVASDPRGGGRLVKRNLGDQVTALHLVVAAAASDPQPARTARRLHQLVETLLEQYGARPNAVTSSGTGSLARHMPLAICGWNGDHGVKVAKILLQYGAVATTEILLQSEGWSMRRLLLQVGKAELPVKRQKGQQLWHDDASNRRPAWMQPYYTAFDDSY